MMNGVFERNTMSTIDQILLERGGRYGEFEAHADICQRLQDVMRNTAGGWDRLACDQKQALTVIADKIARMLNGDPSYLDNWTDIVGYATLVEKRMRREESSAKNADSLNSFEQPTSLTKE